MAFQIRRAYRFLPSHQDQIALRTSNRTKRGKVSGTFPLSTHGNWDSGALRPMNRCDGFYQGHVLLGVCLASRGAGAYE